MKKRIRLSESEDSKYLQFIYNMNKKLGRKNDFKVIKVTNIDEMPLFILSGFHSNKKVWQSYLDIAPIFIIMKNKRDFYLIQDRSPNMNIYDNRDRPVSESELLNSIGIGHYGIPLKKILGMEE